MSVILDDVFFFNQLIVNMSVFIIFVSQELEEKIENQCNYNEYICHGVSEGKHSFIICLEISVVELHVYTFNFRN